MSALNSSRGRSLQQSLNYNMNAKSKISIMEKSSQPFHHIQGEELRCRNECKPSLLNESGSCNQAMMPHSISRETFHDYSFRKRLTEISEERQVVKDQHSRFDNLTNGKNHIYPNTARAVSPKLFNLGVKSCRLKEKNGAKGQCMKTPQVQKKFNSSKKDKVQRIIIGNKVYKCKNVPVSYFEAIPYFWESKTRINKTVLKQKTMNPFKREGN